MLEFCILLLFSVSLIICVILHYSILYALIFGYILFFAFGLIKGETWKKMFRYSFHGILTVKNILIIFILIGSITAIWRACGTIAFIVYYASMFAAPQIIDLLFTMLLCIISDGHGLRKCCNYRHYLYDIGKQYEYPGRIRRRSHPLGNIFRRSLLADVVGGAFNQ